MKIKFVENWKACLNRPGNFEPTAFKKGLILTIGPGVDEFPEDLSKVALELGVAVIVPSGKQKKEVHDYETKIIEPETKKTTKKKPKKKVTRKKRK